MCLDIRWKHGIVLGTCSGVVIPEDAEIWEMRPSEVMSYLHQALLLLPYVYDIELLDWYKMNDRGCMAMPPSNSVPGLLEAARRMPQNPFADQGAIGFASALRWRLEEQPTQQSHYMGHHPVSPRRPRDGYVYLLSGGPYYKIGCTVNVDRRIAQIQPQMPFIANLICIIPADDMRGLEAELHRRFADKRANGEWFELDEKDVEYIKELARGQQNSPV